MKNLILLFYHLPARGAGGKVISLDNYWLAGFTQADGCFHISIVKSKTHKTGYCVKLEYSLKQNDELPLKLLYNLLKRGNLSHYSSGIWCYKSTGYKTAFYLINYFDKFNLFAGKYIDYLKFSRPLRGRESIYYDNWRKTSWRFWYKKN